jgi:CheY-like chemotaxis protein
LRVWDRDTARSVDWVLIRKDAAKRFVESSISLLKDLKGRPAGFSVFLRDITERQRSEALRQAKLAAEAANRSKGEFLASMSHEIRTPLNAVIGLVDLMLASDLRPDQREDLDVVRSSAYALLSIINDVLDFSKIEAGRLELDKAAFGIEQFLDESLKIMAMKAHSKGIELACRLASEVPDRLVGDLTRFRQVLLNLVDNAIKFTARGEVIVSVTRRAVTETEVTLQVTVTDTGIGIAPDAQRRIFEAYDQDPSVSQRYGGTGQVAVSPAGACGRADRVACRGGGAFGHRQTPAASALRLDRARRARRQDRLVVGEAARAPSEGGLTRRDERAAAPAPRRPCSCWGRPAPARPCCWSGHARRDGFDLPRAFAGGRPRVVMCSPAHLGANRARRSAWGDGGQPLGPREPERARPGLRGPGRYAPGQHSADAASGRALTVLVAEDTAFNQKFIMRLLERWGHVAVLAEDGRKAVAAFSAGRFDVVFMDVAMPEVDGLEAARAIRRLEESRGGRTPIIAMTAHAIKGDHEHCLAAGWTTTCPSRSIPKSCGG